MTSLIESLQQRQSIALVSAPAPSPQEWDQVIQAATAAPDHGRLRPWQFRLIDGDGLNALGQLFLKAYKNNAATHNITLSQEQLERTKGLPHRAPAILLVVAQVQTQHKIPIVEQVNATAAAAQNIQLALMDLGYGCMWRTGDFAFYDEVKTGLGFASHDEIVGFLYVGTPQKQPAPRQPQDIKSCFQRQEW